MYESATEHVSIRCTPAAKARWTALARRHRSAGLALAHLLEAEEAARHLRPPELPEDARRAVETLASVEGRPVGLVLGELVAQLAPQIRHLAATRAAAALRPLSAPPEVEAVPVPPPAPRGPEEPPGAGQGSDPLAQLRAWMEARDMSAGALARDLGVNKSTVGRWLSGKTQPRRIEHLQAIEGLTGISFAG